MKDAAQKSSFEKVLRLAAIVLAAVLIWQVLIPAAVQFVNTRRAAANAAQSAAVPTREDKAQSYYALASASIENDDYPAALEQLAQARAALGVSDNELAQNEQNRLLLAELWLKTASLYILTNELDKANTALNEALKADPNEENALLLRAQLEIENGNAAAAISDMAAYLELAPQDDSSRQTYAQLLENAADYKGAAAQYEYLYSQAPDDESFNLNALRCLFLNGEYERAIAGFDDYKQRNAALAADPYGGIADFLRAACLVQLEDYVAAAQGFEAALAAGFDKASCLEQAVLCYFENEEYQNVITAGNDLFAIEGALVSAPELTYQQMGVAAIRLGDNEQALTYLDNAAQLDPKLEGNEYYRGICLLSLDRMEEAAQAFTASIASGFLMQFCHYNRGVCYVELQEYDKAAEDMQLTLETGDDPDLIAAAQDILTQLEKLSE